MLITAAGSADRQLSVVMFGLTAEGDSSVCYCVHSLWCCPLVANNIYDATWQGPHLICRGTLNCRSWLLNDNIYENSNVMYESY